MTFPSLHSISTATSKRGGFVPDSLKEMKRGASCRKFNIGALSTPKAVKKMLSASKMMPDAPTSLFAVNNSSDREALSLTANQGGAKRRASATQESSRFAQSAESDRFIPRQSRGRTALLKRQTSLVATEFQAPTPRRRSNSVGELDGSMGMSLSLSNSRRNPAALGTSNTPTRRTSITPTRQRSGLTRNSRRGVTLTPSRRSHRQNLATPNSHSSQRRHRRHSVDCRLTRKIPQVASNLDDGMSDNDLSVGHISIDETVEGALLTNGEGGRDSHNKSSKSAVKRSTSFIDKRSDCGSSRRRVVRRVSSAMEEGKHMSRSSYALYTTSSRSAKSRSSDHSAFCTPKRSGNNKIQMTKGDMSGVSLALDDLSIDDTVTCVTKQQQRPKVDRLNKHRRATSDESRKSRRKVSGRSKSFVEGSFTINEQAEKAHKTEKLEKCRRSKADDAGLDCSKLEKPKKHVRSISDEVALNIPKMEKPKKYRRAASGVDGLEVSSLSRKSERNLPKRSSSFVEVTRNGSVSPGRCEEAVKSLKEKVSLLERTPKGELSKRKLPRRSKTLGGPIAATLKTKDPSKKKSDTPRMPARSKSFSIQKSKEASKMPVLTVLEETKTPSTPDHKRKSIVKKTRSRDFNKTQSEEEASRDDGPPAVIEINDVDVDDTMESFPTGYCEEADTHITEAVSTIPTNLISQTGRTPTTSETWRCNCGHESSTVMKCCGMCGSRRNLNWTCNNCHCSENLGIFQFCGMCGDRKKKGVQRAPISPLSVVA